MKKSLSVEELVTSLDHLRKTGALVQAVLAFASGGANIWAVVTGATLDKVTIGAQGYELLFDPKTATHIETETPFDSDSPAAARMSERVAAIYDIGLANGDRLLISERFESAVHQQH